MPVSRPKPVALAGALLASLLLVPAVCTAHTVEVTASGLNVRSGPGTNYRVLGVATRGQDLPLLGPTSGKWLKVRFSGKAGWVHGDYVRRKAAAAAPAPAAPAPAQGVIHTVTATVLNVRSGPGTRYREVGELRRGEQVRVVSSQGDWRRIAFRGGHAWVHGAYLVRGNSAPGGGGGGGGGGSQPSHPRSSVGYIQLPASGPGFYSYAVSSRRWGTPTMIYGIERAARRWQAEQTRPRMGIGEISDHNGGYLSGHLSHRTGKDVDVRPMRRDSYEGPTDRRYASYSRYRTARVIQLMRAELPETLVLFNDRNVPGTQYWPSHDNHFHLRIR